MRSAPASAVPYTSDGKMPPSPDGGAHATTVSTPATFGTSTVMNGDASSGTRPAGRYAPTRPTGTSRWPATTPGDTSNDSSPSVSSCARANAVVRSAASCRYRRTSSSVSRSARAICSRVSSNDGGSQPSRSRE